MRAAEELGYRPNPIARGLKTNRSFTVGVLVPDLTNPLFPPIVRGIEDRLGAAGYTSLIANTDNDPDRERQDFEAMRARQVDGFITATRALDREIARRDARPGEPIMLVNRRLEDEQPAAVTLDDREGAAWPLRTSSRSAPPDRPPRRPAGDVDRPPALPRLPRGDGGAPGSRSRTARDPLRAGVHRGRGRARLPRRCSTPTRTSPRSSRPTTCWRSAAMTCSPSAACAARSDVSVVGFNDMPFADRFDPPLTTVRIPHREIGSAAADLLLERLGEPRTTPRRSD